MSSSVSGKKQRALLVGVDIHPRIQPRKDLDNAALEFADLKGCVNDVIEFEEHLLTHFPDTFDSIVKLTSSYNKTDPSIPSEPPAEWPTFSNIEQHFLHAHNELGEGDFFFFHFSGHGAYLPSTATPPGDREPSLLTADFNFNGGNPAVRGWQLNEWLEKLENNGVRVVVSLDSCYSGGTLRQGEAIRTPHGWPNLPNLDVDYAAAKRNSDSGGFRDAVLETSWSINPKNFTLLTACDRNQGAAERNVNGKYLGVFTCALLRDLEQHKSPYTSYLAIQARIIKSVEPQTPVFFGRVRLLFFGETEPIEPCPVSGLRSGETLSLPIGTIHGVCRHSEFSTIDFLRPVVYQVVDVGQLRCTAQIVGNTLAYPDAEYFAVVPSRWSFGQQVLTIVVDPSCMDISQNLLVDQLIRRISSVVQVVDNAPENSHNGITLHLTLSGGRLHIRGTEPNIHYEELAELRPHQLLSRSDLESKIAVNISHLARFSQLVNLKGGPSNFGSTPPFIITWGSALVDGVVKQTFQLNSNSQDTLFVSLINFRPGFGVQVLAQQHPVPCNHQSPKSFEASWEMSVPDKLKDSSGSETQHRDIFRALVTKGKNISWTSLELPDIWDAGVGLQTSQRDAKNISVGAHEFSLWMEDHEVLTTA